MVLPNGNVYSRNAMLEMAAHSSNTSNSVGRITCPQTGETYKLEELKKAYIT